MKKKFCCMCGQKIEKAREIYDKAEKAYRKAFKAWREAEETYNKAYRDYLEKSYPKREMKA